MRKNMKKRILLTTILIALGGGLVLSGCSGKGETKESSASSSQIASSKSSVTSTSSESSKTSESSTSPSQEAEKKMNISELADGNFASIQGTWQNDKGEQLVFDENGLVSAEYEFGGASLTDYGTAAGGVYGGQTGGFLLEFIPSGVKLADTENFKDSSDISRDRLWTGVGIQSFGEQGSFYYRLK